MVFYECKLVFHRKSKINDEEILLNFKDFPTITTGCILELYQLDCEKHSLLKVENINVNYPQKDTISIEQQLATSLRFTPNKMIKFQVIDERIITLDVMDLIFKDQYMSRSDMYRFTKSMKHYVLQVNKKIEFGPYRGHVGDMWCKGRRISCGYVGNNTRVVYRSATSVVHIFIQMSQEMWEFDYFGELYFDKAINFISDLFIRWNDNNCGHDVTIVLFSRIFYKNVTEDIIPSKMKKNIKKDYQGRFYEDFYYIVVQNERYMLAEWRKVIKNLKLCFNQYKHDLEQFIQNNFFSDLQADMELSTAEDSNFLETLNMTLNLYENYYIDRNFDRTGKVCVVITAGPGVYNVDRVQTHLTKQRICDLGVGMDLICLGEQPLHAVPLFIFHQKNPKSVIDKQYYIPYWINHSFYRSINELQAIQLGKFIPRIKVRIEKIPEITKTKVTSYDHNVCNNDMSATSMSFVRNLTKSESTHSGSYNHLAQHGDNVLSTSNNLERSCMFSSFSESFASKDDSCIRPVKSTNKKTKKSEDPKALFNPFAPNRFNVRTTSNSRRWSHVFPIDENNKPIQLHHQLVINSPNQFNFQNKRPKNMAEAWKNYYKCFERDNKIINDDTLFPPSSPVLTTRDTSQLLYSKALFYEPEEVATITDNTGSNETGGNSDIISPLPSSIIGTDSQKSLPPSSSNRGSINRKVHTLFTEGEQKWSWDTPKEEESPINHMGVDWKSLILPAILPITSDYYPSSKDLEINFQESNYQLMANSFEDSQCDFRISRKPLGINNVFQELILQRINQGFQLIVEPPSFSHSTILLTKDVPKKMYSGKKSAVYRFGLGRIYHNIEMKQDIIHVTQYSPRHGNNVEDILYTYCMKMIDSATYMMFKTKFSIQMLEKFNWNYHDHYVLNYGGNVDTDSAAEDQKYKLTPSLKFWRSRFYLLPLHSATKVIMDVDKGTKFRCDIYDERTLMAQRSLVDDFFKFLEVINKIKRRAPNSKNSSIQSAGIILSTPNKMQSHRHSTVAESFIRLQQHHSSQSQLLDISRNVSSPVTPIEKLQKQFTFDSTENVMKPVASTENERLSETSPISKVLEAMASPLNGMTFLPSKEFPNEYTFTSYECVNWCNRNIENMDDIKTALAYLQKLMNLKYILHATECPSHKFIYGFVFYCLNISCKKLNNVWQDINDSNIANSNSNSLVNLATNEIDAISNFKRRNIEWVEVSLASLEVDGKSESDWYSNISKRRSFHLTGNHTRNIESVQAAEFLMPSIPNRVLTNCFTKNNIFDKSGNCHDPEMLLEENGVLFKKVVIDIDNEKDDRPEWGTFQFHANYHPAMAFEFMIQWLVATGGKLSERIHQWSRKINNYQLIAVPCDPFALPISINSDPLRGPIFVPLNVDCLIRNENFFKSSSRSIEETVEELFGEYLDSERLYRLILMQEAILKRFGFIKESCVNYSIKEKMQFNKNIEMSGSKSNIFNGSLDISKNIGGSTLKWSYVHYSGGMFAMIPHYNIQKNRHNQHILSSHLDSSLVEDEEWDAPNIGFLWSWNKMLTRKINSASMIVDEQFQDRMLADFKDFCNNDGDRLKDFFEDAKILVQKYFDKKE